MVGMSFILSRLASFSASVFVPDWNNLSRSGLATNVGMPYLSNSSYVLIHMFAVDSQTASGSYCCMIYVANRASGVLIFASLQNVSIYTKDVFLCQFRCVLYSFSHLLFLNGKQ